MAHSGELVPARPFQDWIEDRIQHYERVQDPWNLSVVFKIKDQTVYKVADELGWPGSSGVRRLYRYRHGLKNTSFRGRGSAREVLTWLVRCENAIAANESLIPLRREYDLKQIKMDVPTDWFERIPVEDALHNAGVPFSTVYPDLAAKDDRPLEPDQWCCDCQENVTPIDGTCPWDVKHHLVPWMAAAA